MEEKFAKDTQPDPTSLCSLNDDHCLIDKTNLIANSKDQKDLPSQSGYAELPLNSQDDSFKVCD